jgi:type I restriction enzyme S subunit
MISWLKQIGKPINPIYLVNIFSSQYLTLQLNDFSSGTTVKYLSLEKMKELNILLPPIELQNQFADFVESVEHQKTTALATLNRLETLKNALMQQYFKE